MTDAEKANGLLRILLEQYLEDYSKDGTGYEWDEAIYPPCPECGEDGIGTYPLNDKSDWNPATKTDSNHRVVFECMSCLEHFELPRAQVREFVTAKIIAEAESRKGRK